MTQLDVLSDGGDIGETTHQEVGVNREATVAPLTGVRRDDIAPVCPHCEAELEEIYTRKVGRGPFGIGRGFVFLCPNCRKVLGHGTQWYPFPG